MSDEIAGQGETPPATRARVLAALAIAIATGVFVYTRGLEAPLRKSDFDQVWVAAAALWRLEDPYPLIGLGRAFEWKWPFYYPLPAVVMVAPVGLASVVWARTLFAGVSAGLLAWGLTREGWHRLPVFCSMTFLVSAQLVQWSPLLTAALVIPSLAWVGIAKPNWGIAIAASAHSERVWLAMLVGGSVLTAAAFVLQPDWLTTWLPIVRSARHFATPVTLPFGFLMLAAALRWRRPEARLLLALACLPQTPGFYDALMLFTIPRSWREAWSLVACSYAVFFAMAASGPWSGDAAWMHDIARYTLWFLYLPSVLMVLRRPNHGSFPFEQRWLAWRSGSHARRAPDVVE